MKFRILIPKWLFVLLTVLLLAHCMKKNNNLLGVRFFQRDNMGSELHAIINAANSDTSYMASITNETGAYLYLGEAPLEQSRILFLFTGLPDSGTVDSATVSLRPKRVIGPGNGILTASIHTLTGEWDAAETTWDTFDAGLIGPEIVAKDIDTATFTDTTSITFVLPPATVQSWIDSETADQNYGIILTSSPAPFLIEFYSSSLDNEDVTRPLLIVYLTMDTTKTFAALYPYSDTFIATTQQEPSADRLFVENGTALRTFLTFDIDSIPADATINMARMILYADTTMSSPNHTESFGVQANPVTESNWIIPDIPYETTTYGTGSFTADSLIINITSIVQTWTFGAKPNEGLVIRGSNENGTLYRRAFFSTTADPLLKPKLEIYYTSSPSDR